MKDRRLRLTAIISALIIVPLLLFLPVRHFDLLDWDDNANLTDNSLYRPMPFSHLAELWTKPFFSSYIPVTRMVWADLADVSFGTDGSPTVTFDAERYHLANVVTHIANVILVFLIVRLLLGAGLGKARPADPDHGEQAPNAVTAVGARHGEPQATHASPVVTRPTVVTAVSSHRLDWAAAFGALVFAVHPLQVEPVAWITGMKDLLGAFFSFLAIWLYLLFATSASDRRPWGLFVGASLAYVLAILSKSTAVVLPVMMLLLDYLISKHARSVRSDTDSPPAGESPDSNARTWLVPPYRLIALGFWVALAIPDMMVATYSDHMLAAPIPMVPVWQRPFVAGDSMAFYLCKLLIPVSLCPDYGRTPVWLMRHAWAYASILAPIVMVAVAWRLRSRSFLPIAAAGLFVIGLLPVSGFTPFAFQVHSSVADRYVYVVMMGVVLVLAEILTVLPSRMSIALGLSVLTALSLLSMRQVAVWSDTTTLFTQNLRVNPGSALSYTFLGAAKEEIGDLDGAIADYRLALQRDDRYTPALHDVGQALTHLWQRNGSQPEQKALLDEAEADLRKAVIVEPRFHQAHASLGYVYYLEGRNFDAITEFQAAVHYHPNNPTAFFMLSALYSRVGDADDALACMRRAADLGLTQARQILQRSGAAPAQP